MVAMLAALLAMLACEYVHFRYHSNETLSEAFQLSINARLQATSDEAFEHNDYIHSAETCPICNGSFRFIAEQDDLIVTEAICTQRIIQREQIAVSSFIATLFARGPPQSVC